MTKGREEAEHHSSILPRRVTLEVSQESQKKEFENSVLMEEPKRENTVVSKCRFSLFF